MARAFITPFIIFLVAFVLMAGCTTPTPSEVNETLIIPPVPSLVETVLPAVETTPVAEPTPPVEATTAGPASQEIYYKNLPIFMDRKQYEVINFEDIGQTYLNSGETYTVRFTSDHPIFAYVIRTMDVPRLNAEGGTPVYDPITRTYDYGRLLPLMKIEDAYEDGASFTVKDFGKYSLVLDTRLTQKDYHFSNEVAHVAVRILKLNKPG